MKARYFKQLLISLVLICLVNLITFISPVLANDKVVNVYFFYSQTCPHCTQQKPLMKYIDRHNEEVNLSAYEVSKHQKEWQDFLVQYQIKSAAVPRTLIGEKLFIGYSEADGKLEYNPVYVGYIGYKNQIVQAIESELGHSINLPGSTVNYQPPWKIIWLPILYLLS